MLIVCVIQARMSSTRLPGKVLLDLGGVQVLDHVIKRVQASNDIDQVLIATTTNKNDDLLVEHLKQEGQAYYRGDEENVLRRYYESVRGLMPDHVVRVTSDCPFIDPVVIDAVIKKHIKENNDYTSNTLVAGAFPLGFSCEVLTYKSLEVAFDKATEKYELEHVTPYLYKNPDRFKIGSHKIDCTDKQSKIRATLDTKEDYLFIKTIYDLHTHFQRDISLKSIIDLCTSVPGLCSLNSQVTQKSLRSSHDDIKNEAKDILSSHGLLEIAEFIDQHWSSDSES